MNSDLQKKIKEIKLLILDVDGVLTNGDIILDAEGKEIKKFNVYDGYGIVLLQKTGIKTAILSARHSAAVTARAKDLKMTRIRQNAYPKIEVYKSMIKNLKLGDHQVCFMGDDLPDIQVLKKVGFSVTVPGAHPEVKKVADYITKKEGGCGAVREVVELILKAQQKWAGILRSCRA